ncbi:MAG TPA: prepilin-type N-terminal cleavage/methylation domain-containing protein [Gemmatimonadaceae bacterium]|nr:prepilin-type N-terminal cleavage/methylation domain-containing protein [Gemmatimonadaceae bacterium]
MRLSRRSGFSLIELVIACTIIGILAAIGVPNYHKTKGKAAAASMKNDLHTLVTAQEAYFGTNGTYSSNLAALNVDMSRGVSITWGTVNAQGWSAVTRHPNADPLECAIFFGNVAPLAPAISEGVLRCQ